MGMQMARIPLAKASQLGSLRAFPGLEVHEAGDEIWLWATEDSEEIQQALKALPGAMLYRVFEDQQLCPVGSRVPQGYLPQGSWQPLAKWLQIERPSAAIPGQLPERAPLKLVRHQQPREANALITSMDDWLTYGSTAPQVRLECWRFAVSQEGEVFIQGTPLPPLPGTHFVVDRNIAVPCGWHWSPAVDADIVSRLFSDFGTGLMVWREPETIETIADDQFVRATRSAIRLSAKAVASV